MGANSQPLPPVVKNRTSSHRNRYESIVDRTRRLFQQKTPTDRAPFSLRGVGSTLRPVSPTGWKRSRRQNRYKSILCHEDTYLLELVRYIHLNPLRAKLIKDFDFLKKYPYSGHSTLMGTVKNDWQDIKWVLRLFNERMGVARRRYHQFVEMGISMGRREDLTGGGLIRSMGGWAAVKSMRKAKMFEKSDERILGDGDFVSQVLSAAEEQMEQRTLSISNIYGTSFLASQLSPQHPAVGF